MLLFIIECALYNCLKKTVCALIGLERLFVYDGTPLFDEENGALAKNCTIIGNFDYHDHPPCTIAGTVMPFDNGYWEIDTQFVNFAGEVNGDYTCAAIGMLSLTCVCATFCGGYEYR